MERDMIVSGVHIGEHAIEPKDVLQELRERCVEPGYRFATIRTGYNSNRPVIEEKYFLEWAKYLAENQVYFVFLYTLQHAPDGRRSALDAQTVAKIHQIAGEYFLGDMIGETGASYACKFPGYYNHGFGPGKDPTLLTTDFPDMKTAAQSYIENIAAYTATDREFGMPEILSVEPTWLHKYNAAGGVTVPMLELMYGNPEASLATIRGTARANRAKLWGTYIAHEWYGGLRHEDMIKRKRLELGYKYAYLAGSNTFCLESGDEAIESYDTCCSKDSQLCREYRQMQDWIAEFIRNDARPKGGPKVKVAFVSGLYDGFGGWGGSTVWNQFGREEWYHKDAEHAWQLLNQIGTKRTWNDLANYGSRDLSAYPAYGMYDIVPMEADLTALCRYAYLIFLGWNSMTEENLDKLTAFVEQGGKLLMCAAHLNCQTKRDGPFLWPDRNKLQRLFGADFTGETFLSNNGLKFNWETLNENAMYPATRDHIVDPLYSAGNVCYAKLECNGCNVLAGLADTFLDEERNEPVVIENRVGKGVATLVASMNYPGHPALQPLYRDMVREFVTMSARACPVQVLGCDRLRYSVYEGNKVYLLNTDYDMPIAVKILYNGSETNLMLESLELKCVEL